MLRVTCVDGAIFTGKDEKDIVRQMKHTDWNAPERKGEYMEDVAARVDTMMGQEIRVTSAKVFLRDMQTVGLLTIQESSTPGDDEGRPGAHSDQPS